MKKTKSSIAKYLADIRRKSGEKSKRKLTKKEARAMAVYERRWASAVLDFNTPLTGTEDVRHNVATSVFADLGFEFKVEVAKLAARLDATCYFSRRAAFAKRHAICHYQ